MLPSCFGRVSWLTRRAVMLLAAPHDLGQPQARLMDAFEPEADLTVWLATNARTRKVRQLRHDPRATLAYDAGGGTATSP